MMPTKRNTKLVRHDRESIANKIQHAPRPHERATVIQGGPQQAICITCLPQRPHVKCGIVRDYRQVADNIESLTYPLTTRRLVGYTFRIDTVYCHIERIKVRYRLGRST